MKAKGHTSIGGYIAYFKLPVNNFPLPYYVVHTIYWVVEVNNKYYMGSTEAVNLSKAVVIFASG